MTEIFISEQNNQSQRWVVFEDNGESGWLYLTEPNSEKPIASCWVYNRIEAPNYTEISKYRNGPPPASNEYVSANSLYTEPKENNIKFKWSKDGNSVALIYNEISLSYIISNCKTGFSRNLVKSGPWGNIFDEDKYVNFFQEENL